MEWTQKGIFINWNFRTYINGQYFKVTIKKSVWLQSEILFKKLTFSLLKFVMSCFKDAQIGTVPAQELGSCIITLALVLCTIPFKHSRVSPTV
jgi:hypothetical protein